MSIELSIVHDIDLAKLVKAMNEIKSLNSYTACVQNNILRIIECCFFRWIPGTVDFARYSDRYRTSLVHFLNEGKWDFVALVTNLCQSALRKLISILRKPIGWLFVLSMIPLLQNMAFVTGSASNGSSL